METGGRGVGLRSRGEGRGAAPNQGRARGVDLTPKRTGTTGDVKQRCGPPRRPQLWWPVSGSWAQTEAWRGREAEGLGGQ